MRRAPGGVSPFNARQDETASASPRPHSGDSGTIPEKRDPGSTEETRLSFDGVSPLAKPLAGSRVTPREAAINLANCIMGAGALSLPSFFKSTGAVLGVALLLASCAWTWFSAVMMVKAADAVSVRVLDGVPVSSYEELMDLTLGRNGKRLSAVGILLLQIGCLVGYANILADVASPFAISVLPPGLEPNRGAVLAAVTLGAMLPIGVAVGGDGGSAGLAAVSKASIVIVGAFALLLSATGLAKTAELASGSGSAGGSDVDALNMVRSEGILSVLPLAIFAFGAHPAILPVTRAMRPSGLKPSVSVVTDVLRLCAAGYLMIGLGGYASFRAGTAGNVLRNMDGSGSFASLGGFGSKALKFGYGLVILASVPTILLPLQKSARDAYLALLPYVVPPAPLQTTALPRGANENENENENVSHADLTHRGETRDDLAAVSPEIASRLATVVAVASMTCALYLSLYVPNVAFAFGLTGSTCSFLIAFVLPAASFLSATAAGARRLPGAARERSLELARRDASRRGARAKTADEVGDKAEEAFAAAAASGASVSARGESSLMRRSASREGSDKGGASSWAWFGGEDPDSDDALRHDDGFDDGFVRADALFDDGRNGSSSLTPSRGGSNGAPVSPKTKSKSSSSSSKLASTRRWRLGAKAQILAAIVLSVVCTREVVRELVHENALVTVVSKMAEAKASAQKMEKESVTIAAAKETFVENAVQLERASKDAERALDEVHHADAGSATDAKLAEDIDVIATTLEERLSEAIGGRADEAGDETKSAYGGGDSLATTTGTRAVENAEEGSAETKAFVSASDPSETTLRSAADEETIGKRESSPADSKSESDGASDDAAKTASVAEASLEKVRKVEAAASDTTAAKSALENAIKHSDDEVRKVRDRRHGGEKAETSGKAVDEERKESEEEGLDSRSQIAADAEARREVTLSSASRGRDRDEGDEGDGGASSSRSRSKDSRKEASVSAHLTAANASDVVAMADEKIHELNDAKAKAETEAEQALETAVTAEGVDETLASELARALVNLTGSE